MNESICTGLYTPELSRIDEQEENSRRTYQQSRHHPKTPLPTAPSQEEEDQLTQIEAQIKETGGKLEQLHYEMRAIADKYSVEFLEKEHERNSLRKQLIDLDYNHKTVFARKVRKNAEEAQQARATNAKQHYYQQYETQKQEAPEEETHNSRNTREPMVESKLEMRDEFEKEKESEKEQSQADQQWDENKEVKELEESRRRLRIAEIEAELTANKLRRSRIEMLSEELTYLRASYYYPLHSYSSPYLSALDYPPLYSRWWLY